jgi:hypothetical protein
VSTNQQSSRARIVCLTALGVFILACLFPPWLYTFDLNGRGGGHSRKPAGYYFIARPPPPEEPPHEPTPSDVPKTNTIDFRPDVPDFGQDSYAIAVAKRHYGVQIDFARLAIEWAALAAATGMVWVFVVRPPWSRDDKANRPKKFIPPTGDSKN